MRRLILIFLVFSIFVMACAIGSATGDNPQGSNPGNLNTPSDNNPGQDINTPLPDTPFNPNLTPIGSSPETVTPGAPTIITATPGS